MIMIPWFTTKGIHNDGGMAIAMLSFYILNPIYHVILGIFSAKSIYKDPEDWITALSPFWSALLFYAGTFFFYDPTEMLFAYYSFFYLIFSGISMIITIFIINFKTKN